MIRWNHLHFLISLFVLFCVVVCLIYCARVTTEISNTMGDARRKLEERKEKLDNMADKSKDLMDDADEFERMCRKLAENEKKKSSWW